MLAGVREGRGKGGRGVRKKGRGWKSARGLAPQK